MGKQFVVAFVAALLATGVQAAGLPVGMAQFDLGSPQAAVMAKVNSEFKVIPVSDNPNKFLLASIDAPSDVIGGVAFSRGRLSWVLRIWGNYCAGTHADKVARSLYGALSNASSESGAIAHVTTTTRSIPGTEFRTTTFQFGKHQVTLTETDGKLACGGSHQVEVDESIAE